MSSNGIDSNGMGGNGTKNGSGLKNAHIRVSSSSIEPLTKMERLMYHGIVTPSLSAHILYCLQHSSIHLNVLHSLLHLSLDSNIEKDETNNFNSILNTNSYENYIKRKRNSGAHLQFCKTRYLFVTIFLDLILMPTTISSIRCVGLKSISNMILNMNQSNKELLIHNKNIVRKLTLLSVLIGTDEKKETQKENEENNDSSDEEEKEGTQKEQKNNEHKYQGETKHGKYSKRRRSNVAVIHVRIVFIGAFLFHCLLLNHSFQTKPNKITNCLNFFSLFTILQLHCSCVAF